MGYSIDLHQISLIEHKASLQERILIPSQQMLREDIDTRFAAFEAAGIRNCGDLLRSIKTKAALQRFSQQTGVGEDYLAALGRQLKGQLSKPRKLSDFHWISADTITNLDGDRIRTTKQLYDFVRTPDSRTALTRRLDLDSAAMLELTKQSDLTRIQWVNANFARVLYAAGCDTLAKVQAADPEILHERILTANAANGFYRGNIGLNDVRICVEAAQAVDRDIEY